MSDNASPFNAGEYEEQMRRVMPFYGEFHNAAIDIVRTVNPAPRRWLDTGCGTGNFAAKAAAAFAGVEFFLADPSAGMLEVLRRNPGVDGEIVQKTSARLDFPDGCFDVVTAILSHHYSDEAERRAATLNCRRMLKQGGIYVTFENIRPLSSGGVEIFMRRWMNYKISHGEPRANESVHYSRFGREYLPITIPGHIALMKECGFREVEILWASYMQAGFFAIK